MKHDYENNIKCPYCDHEWQDSWEFEDHHETHTCGNCGEVMNVIRHIEITYSTSRISCEENKKEHDFQFKLAHCKDQKWISSNNWQKLPESEWTYFEKLCCSVCGEVKYNDITKEQYEVKILIND